MLRYWQNQPHTTVEQSALATCYWKAIGLENEKVSNSYHIIFGQNKDFSNSTINADMLIFMATHPECTFPLCNVSLQVLLNQQDGYNRYSDTSKCT